MLYRGLSGPGPVDVSLGNHGSAQVQYMNINLVDYPSRPSWGVTHVLYAVDQTNSDEIDSLEPHLQDCQRLWPHVPVDIVPYKRGTAATTLSVLKPSASQDMTRAQALALPKLEQDALQARCRHLSVIVHEPVSNIANLGGLLLKISAPESSPVVPAVSSVASMLTQNPVTSAVAPVASSAPAPLPAALPVAFESTQNPVTSAVAPVASPASASTALKVIAGVITAVAVTAAVVGAVALAAHGVAPALTVLPKLLTAIPVIHASIAATLVAAGTFCAALGSVALGWMCRSGSQKQASSASVFSSHLTQPQQQTSSGVLHQGPQVFHS